MENKICVYAICKNEGKFVNRWLDSMSEADYIVVLDTGSEDNTYELLKNDKRVYRVEQKVIKPWRFDVARNESLKLVPDDANILICTDLDETLDAGWADVIRKNWIDGFHVRGYYKYAWSHNDKGEPGRIFHYDKLHDRNWKWSYPVHEMLTTDVYKGEYVDEHSINLFDEVYLHHYPDSTKSRGSYLKLLELRVEEDINKEDYYGRYYLSHEYYYRGFYEKCISTLEDLLTNKDFEKYQNSLERAAAYMFIGDSYRRLNKKNEALNSYFLAICEEPSFREPYLFSAEVLNELGIYHLAIGMIQECISKTYRHYSWLERDNSWLESIDDILSISYFYIGEIDKSYFHVKKALAFDEDNKRIRSNYELISSFRK